jgi:hypothetical protein
MKRVIGRLAIVREALSASKRPAFPVMGHLEFSSFALTLNSSISSSRILRFKWCPDFVTTKGTRGHKGSFGKVPLCAFVVFVVKSARHH